MHAVWICVFKFPSVALQYSIFIIQHGAENVMYKFFQEEEHYYWWWQWRRNFISSLPLWLYSVSCSRSSFHIYRGLSNLAREWQGKSLRDLLTLIFSCFIDKIACAGVAPEFKSESVPVCHLASNLPGCVRCFGVSARCRYVQGILRRNLLHMPSCFLCILAG